MARNIESGAAIDALLRLAALGGLTTAMLIAPNTPIVLDKPLAKVLDGLDRREKERKMKQLLRYMKTRGLVADSYSHGLTITKSGKKRLEATDVEHLSIDKPDYWDKKWRLIFFDIPETNRRARVALINTLRDLGFQLLQRSIWVHPFACKEVVYRVCDTYEVRDWVTYIETSHIDREEDLIKRFKLTKVL